MGCTIVPCRYQYFLPSIELIIDIAVKNITFLLGKSIYITLAILVFRRNFLSAHRSSLGHHGGGVPYAQHLSISQLQPTTLQVPELKQNQVQQHPLLS